MTQPNDGGPAFPQGYREAGGHSGMSLRDWYAGQALSSIPLRSWDYLSAEDDKVRAWATLAYAVADAMLTARSPAPEGGETRRAVPRDWVCCPICGEPDMQKETDDQGASLIFCVNHGCRSNGGDSDLQSAPRPDQTDLLQRLDAAANERLIDWAADWQNDPPSSRSPAPKFIEAEAAGAIRARDALLREARDALDGFLRFYRVDEIPNKVSAVVHENGRHALARIQEALGDE